MESLDFRALSATIINLMNLDSNFTDILLESDAPIMLKSPFGWAEAESEEIPTMESMDEFLQTIDPDWKNEILKSALNRPLDLVDWRLRVNAYLAFGGKKVMASIRRVPTTPPTFAETGLPPSARLMLSNQSGLILLSGPTGSGKTTSMAAMLVAISEARNAHIVTIEDPIEFVYKRNKSIFSQREIGVDCATFFDGVKDAMRQRPDVIVIGEIRDRDTAEQALLAGESGHLVIGTLHASSAVGTITKMLGFFSAGEREARLQALAGSLVGIVNQALIPKKSGDGYALAVDFLSNHKRQFSRIIGDPDKVQSMLDRKEDAMSLGMGDSIIKLITDGVVDKAEAARVVAGNAAVYDRIRTA